MTQPNKICPRCRYLNEVENAFCGKCGRRFSSIDAFLQPIRESLNAHKPYVKPASYEEAQKAWEEWDVARKAGKPLPLPKGKTFKFKNAKGVSVRDIPNAAPLGKVQPLGVFFGCVGVGCGGSLLMMALAIFALVVLFLLNSGG